MKMPAKTMNHSCCKANMQSKMACHMKGRNSSKKGCCEKSDATCSCFYYLQILAPSHLLPKSQFQSLQAAAFYNMYMHRSWNNPFIDEYVQPPDFV